jgi:hypothetical protein
MQIVKTCFSHPSTVYPLYSFPTVPTGLARFPLQPSRAAHLMLGIAQLGESVREGSRAIGAPELIAYVHSMTNTVYEHRA